MTDRYDQKLVEAAARAAFEDLKRRWGAEQIGPSWETLASNLREDWLSSTRAILAAVDASGTHLVTKRCQPIWGSCELPSGHYGQHNAYALAERHGEGR